jgi:hypothetical protein
LREIDSHSLDSSFKPIMLIDEQDILLAGLDQINKSPPKLDNSVSPFIDLLEPICFQLNGSNRAENAS